MPWGSANIVACYGAEGQRPRLGGRRLQPSGQQVPPDARPDRGRPGNGSTAMHGTLRSTGVSVLTDTQATWQFLPNRPSERPQPLQMVGERQTARGAFVELRSAHLANLLEPSSTAIATSLGPCPVAPRPQPNAGNRNPQSPRAGGSRAACPSSPRRVPPRGLQNKPPTSTLTSCLRAAHMANLQTPRHADN